MRAFGVMTVMLVGCAPGPLWEKTETDVKVTLNGLHGLSPTDVWAVGDDGTALHFDGAKWTKVPSGTSNSLDGVWAASANDVWLVGESSTVLRWNGSSLQSVPNTPERFEAVRGVSANEVYFCSSSGLYLYDGAFHEFTRANRSLSCRALFPLENGVGALVEQSSIREVHRLSAGGSTQLVTVDTSYSEVAMVAVSSSDVWLLDSSSKSVQRYGSGAPRELVLPTDMSALSGYARSPTDVWLGGDEGRMAHYDGTELTLKVAGDVSSPDIKAIWGTTGVTFAVGSKGWAMRLEE